MSKELLTTSEVADLLKVHEVTVRRWVSDGTLKAYKVGRVLRFKTEDVEKYLESVSTSAIRTGAIKDDLER